MAWIKTPHGMVHVKLAKRPRRRCAHAGCTNWGEYLCDAIDMTRKSKTCDTPMCDEHRRHEDGDLDYCWKHDATTAAQGDLGV